MIRSRVYRDGHLEEEASFDVAELEKARRDGRHRLWIDVVDPSDEELSTLKRVLDLHELSVEDSRRWGQRAKVEFYPGYVFVVLHGLSLDANDELIDSEVHILADENLYLLTIRRAPLFSFDAAIARARATSDLSDEGIGYPLYLILDEIVDDYLIVVDRLEDLADDVEERVFGEQEDQGLQRELFDRKRLVIHFRRLAGPTRHVLDALADHGGLVTQRLTPYYRDVQDHVTRTIELVENVGELLRSSLDARLAQASHRLNIVVKQLTAWAAIILIPTLIAGIYGMNFEHMPELEWLFGYPFALALMGVSAFVLYRVFRRRDWL